MRPADQILWEQVRERHPDYAFTWVPGRGMLIEGPGGSRTVTRESAAVTDAVLSRRRDEAQVAAAASWRPGRTAPP